MRKYNFRVYVFLATVLVSKLVLAESATIEKLSNLCVQGRRGDNNKARRDCEYAAQVLNKVSTDKVNITATCNIAPDISETKDYWCVSHSNYWESYILESKVIILGNSN